MSPARANAHACATKTGASDAVTVDLGRAEWYRGHHRDSTARGCDMSDQQPTVSQAPDADATLGLRPPAPAGTPPELADHPRYRVIKLLGAGGMGAVYLAEHRVMQRPVALKVISPKLV